MTEANFEIPLQREDSIGREHTGRVVDFSSFEHQKENIQPLPRGRSASTLALLYGTSQPLSARASTGSTKDPNNPDALTSAARQSLQPAKPLAPRSATHTTLDSAAGMDIRVSSHLQAQNAQFQAEIAAMDPAETEDPLDVYFRYIQWLFEVFPQATGHQAVIKLVESPLRLFREQERYRNDTRYVKMWIWYTGLINENQEAVFQFLIANNIGDSLAVLYEEYARLLESKEKTRKADEVYQLGVARKAQPLARLERKYMEFQRRVMAQTIRAVDANQAQGQQHPQTASAAHTQPMHSTQTHRTTNENVGPRQSQNRTMLGTKRTGSSVRSVAANVLPQSQRGLPGRTGSDAVASSRPNARISVFSDPDGTSSGAPAHGSRRGHDDVISAPSSSASSSTPWIDIGSDEGRRKENMPEASSWRGQTLEQQRRPAMPPGRVAGAPHQAPPVFEKFTVFSDEAADHGAQSAPTNSHAIDGESGVLGQRTADGSMLRANASGLLSSFEQGHLQSSEAKSKNKPPKSAREKEKAVEKMVMPDHILFPDESGQPQCAEEARSKLPKYAFDYDEWLRQEEEERRRAERPRPIRSKISLNDDDDDDDNVYDNGADQARFPRSKRKSISISSPTINTRMAQKEMLGIWNDVSDSDSDSESILGDNSKLLTPNGRGRQRPTANATVTDDDYQFTMGPVTPHVIPKDIMRLRPVIPTSARLGRHENADYDENGIRDESMGLGDDNAPTELLNSIRAARRQELQSGRSRPTPLSARIQKPARDLAATPLAYGQRPRRGLGDICESDEDYFDDNNSLLAGAFQSKTPLGERIQIFRDPTPNRGSSRRGFAGEGRPEPLFGARAARSAGLGAPSSLSPQSTAPLGSSFDAEYDNPPVSAPAAMGGAGITYSTPARSSQTPFMHGSQTRSTVAATVTRSSHTLGYTRTATGYSMSGAEFSAVSGFTGMSTIGGPTSLIPEHDQIESDAAGDDDHHTGNSAVSHTPMRKRLSMAAKDLGKITPRFPDQLQGHGGDVGDEDDDDDDEEDDGDDDDDDDPCTENIGEFGDLDSQMNELQMQLGTQFMPAVPSSAQRQRGGNGAMSRQGSWSQSPRQAGGTPLFTIFRD
ncbi:protein kinase [Coemansia sp. Benny D115]|nr:protein kinase [Coemansia sp. Benny D115]